MKTTSEKVAEIIVEQLQIDPAEVNANVHLIRDLGADSLDTIELVMAFEEAFSIDIPNEDALRFEEPNCTVGQIVEYIENKLK